VKEGQDPNLADGVGFQVNVNGATRWFNVPWMAVDPTVGREFIHGTTNERTAHLSDLIGGRGRPRRGVHHLPGTTAACMQKYPHGFESWSVGYYNEFGAYSLGRVFPATGRPSLGSYNGTPLPDGLPFPEGTAVVKVLTTSAPEECVPFLKGAPQWTVDRHVFDPAKGYLCDREPQISRVVQIDATFWDRLVPLGLQWGSDPWTFPAVPRADSQPVQQTVLNPGVTIPEHFGCERRLAGPVDNPKSSCLSCHASAYGAPRGALTVMGGNVPPSFGFVGLCDQYSLDNAAYFQNIQAPQAFPGGRFPEALFLDTSLQLEVAFQQFGVFNTRTPQACTDPTQF
jgi:hypothetical protein